MSTDSVLVSHLKCTTVNLHTSCSLRHYVSSASVSHLHMWFRAPFTPRSCHSRQQMTSDQRIFRVWNYVLSQQEQHVCVCV